MGTIGGMNRGPKRPPRARRNFSQLSSVDPRTVSIEGDLRITEIVVGEQADLPATGTDGDMILFYEDSTAQFNLCVYYGGWHIVGLSAV